MRLIIMGQKNLTIIVLHPLPSRGKRCTSVIDLKWVKAWHESNVCKL
jgi:hypothetical protein